ncbi:hypothetical protein DENSPDRAFT_690270 [Dentipellis sp. KUC8613]|nr:hypothetical protein DENSPDRAFT_690270 [Dentipellis sp. KUC8613]
MHYLQPPTRAVSPPVSSLANSALLPSCRAAPSEQWSQGSCCTRMSLSRLALLHAAASSSALITPCAHIAKHFLRRGGTMSIISSVVGAGNASPVLHEQDAYNDAGHIDSCDTVGYRGCCCGRCI